MTTCKQTKVKNDNVYYDITYRDTCPKRTHTKNGHIGTLFWDLHLNDPVKTIDTDLKQGTTT